MEIQTCRNKLLLCSDLSCSAHAHRYACNVPIFNQACNCSNMHRAVWKKTARKHGAFECLCSLCSRKNFIFTDLQSTAPTFPRVYIVYSLQVNCSKLILNTILRVGPFILQCLHIWMSATTTKTSTTFASHHSDVSCKHAERHRIETIIMDKD